MKLACIDLSSVFRINWHASEHEDIGAAYTKTIQAVTSYVGDYDAVAVCIDTPPYRRKELDPNYKAQREKAPEVMHEQLRIAIERLRKDGYHVFGAKGYEADDIIATICEWSESQGHAMTIYSADKDLTQLVTENTCVISTATREKYTTSAVMNKFGVVPDLIPDMLALIGDKSDNIAGVKGVGPKTAAKWINEYAGLDGVLTNADNLEPERFRAIVKESRDQIGKWLQMTTLESDAPINPADMLTPIEPEPEEQEEQYDMEPEEQAPEPEVIEAQQTQAIVKSEYTPTSWDKSLEPRDPKQAWGVASMLFKSRMFGAFPNPESVMAVIMTGRAFGMDAVASLRGFHVIKGKVAPSAALLIGLVKRHPACEYMRFIEGDDKRAVWETKRKDEPEPTRMEYTIEMARRAGLATNDNWSKRPETMLRWRAGTELARVVYPDITSGLYTYEELQDME